MCCTLPLFLPCGKLPIFPASLNVAATVVVPLLQTPPPPQPPTPQQPSPATFRAARSGVFGGAPASPKNRNRKFIPRLPVRAPRMQKLSHRVHRSVCFVWISSKPRVSQHFCFPFHFCFFSHTWRTSQRALRRYRHVYSFFLIAYN